MWHACEPTAQFSYHNNETMHKDNTRKKKEKKRNQELCLQPRGIITHFQIIAVFNKHVYSDDEQWGQMSEGWAQKYDF